MDTQKRRPLATPFTFVARFAPYQSLARSPTAMIFTRAGGVQ